MARECEAHRMATLEMRTRGGGTPVARLQTKRWRRRAPLTHTFHTIYLNSHPNCDACPLKHWAHHDARGGPGDQQETPAHLLLSIRHADRPRARRPLIRRAQEIGRGSA